MTSYTMDGKLSGVMTTSGLMPPSRTSRPPAVLNAPGQAVSGTVPAGPSGFR